jgi:DNA-binding transcriptional LysR family regulator
MQGLAWDDLRYVLAVARFETIAEAARRLEVDEATVARKIARAERVLQSRLFERIRGKVLPTETGKSAAEHAEVVEREIETVIAKTSGADLTPAGRVRLTSVPIIVNHVLIPAVPALLKSHANLQLELIADPRDLSLTKRESDIALRLARPHRELYTLARRVGHLEYAVFGPPGLEADELPWITYDDLMADLPQARWIAEQIQRDGSADPPLRVNDAEALLWAVMRGLGKSLLPTVIANAEQRLSRLFDPSPPLMREIWLLVHPELRDLRRIQVVIDWLTETITGKNAARMVEGSSFNKLG